MEASLTGKLFADKTEAIAFFDEFFQQTYQPFIRLVNNSTRVRFICSRSRKRKSLSKGVRPNQQYMFTGCEARVNIFKSKENFWKVTLVQLRHNHDISKEEYTLYRRRAKLTDQDYELITNLAQANVKDSIIANVLKTERDKFLTTKDVHNIRAKLSMSSSEEQGTDLVIKDTGLDVRLIREPEETKSMDVSKKHCRSSNSGEMGI